MGQQQETSNRKKAANLFWDVIPPIWYRLRSRVDKTAREEYEITGGHYHILRRIKRGDTSVSELADTRHISRPVVSRKVDSLVEKGLVSRRESPEDRRFTVLELTSAGDKILEEIFTSCRGWLEDELKTLDQREVETVIEALAILKILSD